MIDFGPPPPIFPKPAIIRPAADLSRHNRRAIEREFGVLFRDPALAILPGAFPFVGSAYAKPTLSFISETSVSIGSSTITIPTPTAGDLIVICNTAAVGGGDPGDVVPSGFTSVVTALGGGCRIRVSCKISDGTETTVTGMSGTLKDWDVLLFRGSPAISSVTPGGWNAVGTDGNPAAQSLLAAGQTPPLIALGFTTGAGSENARFSTETPAFATSQINESNNEWGFTIFNDGDTPADFFLDMNDVGSNLGFASGYLLCE